MEKQLSNAQQDWQRVLKPANEEFYSLHNRIMQSVSTEIKHQQTNRFLLPSLFTAVIIGLVVFFVYPFTYNNNQAIPPVTSTDTHNQSLFVQGVGGDLNWWLERRNRLKDDDEKTICGFIISLLQGDIGAYQIGATDIDRFITPLNKDLKNFLRGYDAPNGPKIKQIFFSDKIKEQTGVTYNFTYTGDSTIQGQIFEGKMALHINSNDHLIDDLKLEDTKPALGIIYDAEGFFDNKVSNGWRGIIDNRRVDIYAGANKQNPQQGVLILRELMPEGFRNYVYKTPSEHGMVTVLNEENFKLTLKAMDGTDFIFDIKNRSYSGQDRSSLSEKDAIVKAIQKFHYADFPTKPGKSKASIKWGNPGKSSEIPADLETQVKKDYGDYVVTLTETWNNRDFPQIIKKADGTVGPADNPNKGFLSHTWIYRVNDKDIILDNENGDFPPQYSN